MLRLFSLLLETNLSSRVELHFFGDYSDCAGEFERYNHHIGSNIFLHGMVSHKKAFAAMRGADVLVNIGNNTTYQLPSKVIEYLSVDKPILNLANAKTDSSATLLGSYPNSLCLFEDGIADDSALCSRLTRFIKKPPDVSISSSLSSLATFRVETIADAYAGFLTRGA